MEHPFSNKISSAVVSNDVLMSRNLVFRVATKRHNYDKVGHDALNNAMVVGACGEMLLH